MSDPLLTPDRIRAYLIEVAELLPDGSLQCIVVVGGSLLALLGFREATNDVDSIKRLGTSLKDAVAQVADRHGLAPRWLNDSAAGFAPQTFDESACTVELDHPRLRVLGAPLQQVFVMKLFAARALDITDLTAIWSACGFESPEQAADLYHAAYPHLEWDEHLVDEIRAIGERGSDARTIRLGDVDPELQSRTEVKRVAVGQKVTLTWQFSGPCESQSRHLGIKSSSRCLSALISTCRNWLSPAPMFSASIRPRVLWPGVVVTV